VVGFEAEISEARGIVVVGAVGTVGVLWILECFLGLTKGTLGSGS